MSYFICLLKVSPYSHTTTKHCYIPFKVIVSYGEVLLSDQYRREDIQPTSKSRDRVVDEAATYDFDHYHWKVHHIEGYPSTTTINMAALQYRMNPCCRHSWISIVVEEGAVLNGVVDCFLHHRTVVRVIYGEWEPSSWYSGREVCKDRLSMVVLKGAFWDCRHWAVVHVDRTLSEVPEWVGRGRRRRRKTVHIATVSASLGL